jgi:hypothetical protein
VTSALRSQSKRWLNPNFVSSQKAPGFDPGGEIGRDLGVRPQLFVSLQFVFDGWYQHRFVIGLRQTPTARKRRDIVGKILQHLDHDVLLTGMGVCCRCRNRLLTKRPRVEAKVIHETHVTVANLLLWVRVAGVRHRPGEPGPGPASGRGDLALATPNHAATRELNLDFARSVAR